MIPTASIQPYPSEAGKAQNRSEEITEPWIGLVRRQVKSLRYGLVQIVVHDGQVTQIERTERVRLEKQPPLYEI
jgi:hypothetical protein